MLTVEEDEAGGREDSQRLQRFCLPLKHEHLFMPAGPDRLDQTATGAARRPVGRRYLGECRGDDDRVIGSTRGYPSVPSLATTSTLVMAWAARLRRACAARPGQISMLTTWAASRASSAAC